LTEYGNGTSEPTDGVLPPPPPRTSRRTRNALIGGATTAGVAAVVLLIVFIGHRGSDTGQKQALTVSPRTFKLQATITAALEGSDVVGCTLAEDALLTVTDVFAKDVDNHSIAVADTQKAIDQADLAAEAARTPALRGAVAAMKSHLTALHDSARANDSGSEAAALQSIRGDMTAVSSACGTGGS